MARRTAEGKQATNCSWYRPELVYKLCWSHLSKCDPVLWRHHLLLLSVPKQAKSCSSKALNRAFFKCGLRNRVVCAVESLPYGFTHDNMWSMMKTMLDENTWSHGESKASNYLFHKMAHTFFCFLLHSGTASAAFPPAYSSKHKFAYTQKTLEKGIKCVFKFSRWENRTKYENRRKCYSSFQNNMSALKRGLKICPACVCKGSTRFIQDQVAS